MGRKAAMKRRLFLKDASMAAAGLAVGRNLGLAPQAPAVDRHSVLLVDPAPLFELSPYLYMQFMEPLGATDGAVEAAWDHAADRWRDDVLAVTRDLAPTMMRWGGIFVDFYRWREGVGPRNERPSMLNLLWGGLESNQSAPRNSSTCARPSGPSRSSASTSSRTDGSST